MATVTRIGTAQNYSTGSFSYTCPAGVAQGHGIVLIFFATPIAGSISAIIDSSSNSWQTDASQSDGNDNTIVIIASTYVATAIAASGTISGTVNGNCTVIAYDVSSFASLSWVDQVVTNVNAVSTSVSIGPTGTLAQSNELVIYAGCGGFGSGTNTFTPTGGSTLLDSFISTGSKPSWSAYQFVASTAAFTGTGTLATSADNEPQALVTYKLPTVDVVTAVLRFSLS